MRHSKLPKLNPSAIGKCSIINGLCPAFGNWKAKKGRCFVNTNAPWAGNASKTICTIYKGAKHSSQLLQVKNERRQSKKVYSVIDN